MYLYAQASASPAPAGNPIGGFVPLILIFIVFYFLLIRPQRKKEKEHKKTLAALKKDDYVVTTGGIYGTIVNVKPDMVELKIADNTKIQLVKSAIAQVITKQGVSTTSTT